jgi:hypothetical protein
MSESDNVVNINNEINWTEVVKKEARGIEDADFGEVQEIVLHYILTEKGLINREKFYLPTYLVAGFDGEKLRFNISEEEAKEKFQRESAPSEDEYAIYKRKTISTDICRGKQHDKKNNAGLSPDKSEIKTEFEDREAEERIRREVEDRVKQEAERKAQSIEQSIQDKAKQEAERKAQSIAQSIQDKAKQEAERKAQSIEQQAEDRAKQEAERRFKEIIQQAEDRAKQEAEFKKESVQEKSRYFETNNIDENNAFLNPFMTGINIWQNYSLLLMNITREMLSNTRRMTKDFEDTVRENQTNYIGINNTIQKENN